MTGCRRDTTFGRDPWSPAACGRVDLANTLVPSDPSEPIIG